MRRRMLLACVVLACSTLVVANDVKTTALWCFDEQEGLYPSSVLEDASDSNAPLVLGLGGRIVPGKFGNALEPLEHPRVELPHGEADFGLEQLPAAEGRKTAPMSWQSARFAALMTSGEKHLRREVGFVRPTKTGLNLGDFDWTVEFWFLPTGSVRHEGVVFEIGSGPRGEEGPTTQLALDRNQKAFRLRNQPSGTDSVIRSLDFRSVSEWKHLAFVYSSQGKVLKHFVDGRLVSENRNLSMTRLPAGDEDYLSIGRDGLWNHPLPGRIDELRFSEGQVYGRDFSPPDSFSPWFSRPVSPVSLAKGLPLLFGDPETKDSPLQLGDRKHLFIDDAMIAEMRDIVFTVNPPRKAEKVIDNIEGPFRKHLTVIEDEEGLIRIYNGAHDDYLIVHTSKDGVHFEAPDTGIEYRGRKNIVIPERVGGMGNPFIDPNGSGDRKWKYITGYHSRGVYLYTSPDGWKWKRDKMALVPFRSGTQSCTFYDDQRQIYVSTHRTGIFNTPGLATQRSTVVTETTDLGRPILYKPLTQADYFDLRGTKRLREPLPWWLDNGPLTPGDFGLEFPHGFDPDEADPAGTDIYITKAMKYPYAPDTYIAFPIIYFHYEKDGPPARQELMNPKRERGEGPVETQIAVSRDGKNWKRYYRPAYVGVGMHEGIDIKTAYIAHGVVRRGDELWQYYFGEPHYHSAYKKYDDKRAVFRLVQRLDGFVSLDSPYEKEAYLQTKPFTFEGGRLRLNIDTDAAGYAQVGFLDEKGLPIKGFSVDDCIYLNGDFIDTEVEWLGTGSDVSSLQGKTVQLIFRMRGSKLYSMRFSED
jgi:hypothetical protein